MKNILYISSSISGADGHSSKLAAQYLDALGQRESIAITHRDLNAQPIPHLDGERFAAFSLPEEQRTAEQAAAATLSEQLIAELRAADEVVIAMPMYNLGVPSTFKAWIDHVVRAGQTFHYTANGPEGLLPDRKVSIIAARGGQYQGTSMDTQSDYIRHVLGLIGLRSLEFTYAEGLARSGGVAEEALRSAQEKLLQDAA